MAGRRRLRSRQSECDQLATSCGLNLVLTHYQRSLHRDPLAWWRNIGTESPRELGRRKPSARYDCRQSASSLWVSSTSLPGYPDLVPPNGSAPSREVTLSSRPRSSSALPQRDDICAPLHRFLLCSLYSKADV